MKSDDKDLKLLQHQSHCKSDVQYRISRDYVSVGWKKGIFGNFVTTFQSLNICQILITQCYAALALEITHFAVILTFSTILNSCFCTSKLEILYYWSKETRLVV